MIKPDIIIIGAMKAATSTVCRYLEMHPRVHMAPGAEPRFFSHDENWEKGSSWYDQFFADSGDKLCAEGSNEYTFAEQFPHAARRMAEYAPGAKLVYMVRHPLTRIRSAWIQNRADSGDAVPPSLDESVRTLPHRFIDPSLYWHQLQQYREHFDDKQIFVGFMEDLKATPDDFWRGLCDFIGVEPIDAEDATALHQNPSDGKRIPSAAYTTANNLPGAALAKKLVPAGLRQWVKREVLSTPASQKPDFSPDVKAALVQTLQPDAEQLLAYCQKPEDFWAWPTKN